MPLLSFVLIILFVVFSPTLAAGEGEFDAEFTKTLLEINNDAWQQLGSPNVPLAQHLESVLGMMSKLQRTVPMCLLKNNAKTALPAEFTEEQRGQVFLVKGSVVFVTEIPFSPDEQKHYNAASYYRCNVLIGGTNTIEVLAPFVPSGWKRSEPIKEPAAFYGVCVKPLADAATQRTLPLFVTPHLEWHPNTFLGNLGFDAASLEQVPPLKITDLKDKNLKLPPFLETLERREVMRRAFRFTDFDRAPFYGLLKALSTLPAGRLEQEARSEQKADGFTVSDLFLKPAETRGKPMLLYGTAKRVIPTLVEDEEVKQLYGIDKYYQIFLFPKESQGNPLVVCVRSLPEGMPEGAEADYAEEITVAAVPYKLWIYESSASLEGKDGKKPNYAPLLIGRCPIHHPKKPSGNPPPSPLFYALFGVMFVVWLLLRSYRARRLRQNIEWKK